MTPKRSRSSRTKRPDRPSAGVARQVKFSCVFSLMSSQNLRDEADDLQPQVLRCFAFAVMLAAQGDQRFRKADEADGQRAVL